MSPQVVRKGLKVEDWHMIAPNVPNDPKIGLFDLRSLQ